MPSTASHQAFISYASGDKDVADKVCAALERREIQCWIAPRNARPGINYGASIVDVIDASPVLVFVLSSRAIASPHVQREVERAANKGVHVIPFRIEDVPLSKTLEYFLEGVHWLDAVTPPLDRHLDYLAETVAYFLSTKSHASVGSGAAGGPDSSVVTGRSVNIGTGGASSEAALQVSNRALEPQPRPGPHRTPDALVAAIPFSLDVLRAAVVGASAGASLAAFVALFTRDAGLGVALAFVLRVAVLSGLITSAWLLGASLQGQRAAGLLGVLAGGLVGWMAESIVGQVWTALSYMRIAPAWTIAGIAQWVAFGLGRRAHHRPDTHRPTDGGFDPRACGGVGRAHRGPVVDAPWLRPQGCLVAKSAAVRPARRHRLGGEPGAVSAMPMTRFAGRPAQTDEARAGR